MKQILVRIALAGFVSGGTMLGVAQEANPNPPAPPSAAEIVKKIDALVTQNSQLEQQNKQLLAEIEALRQALASANGTGPSPTEPVVAAATAATPQDVTTEKPTPAQDDKDKKFGGYTPNFGFKVANTEYGDMSISIYTYVRYLNQRLLDPTSTDSFGNVTTVKQRQDVQIQKVQIKFLGWVLDPKLRYFLYAWTSNATQGQGAQVVLAGNLNYQFSKYFTFGGGIYSLPGTRSVEGNFPFWLSIDSRHIADEFFRPSYSSGFQIKGDLTKTLRYQAMIANNLSTLGVSAAQLPNHFNTFASALVWAPTTGEFGGGFGDFEGHDKVATRFAGHFSRSDENKQSQPSSDSFENTQLRISDGNVIFNPNLFGPGITITDARYKMSTADAGIKYHGFALEGDYFWRWINHFQGQGVSAVPDLFDHGFQVDGSAMVVPKQLQMYLGMSKIFGQFGKPWDARLGTNFFPWKNKVFRWNSELLYLYKSPVGYSSVPFAVGGKGFVFHTNFELAF